jgi:SAM-dependent methyltransferase
VNVDFGRTASDYSRHRAGFPDELFDRLKRVGICQPGKRVLDLGTGTGSLARGFAKRGCQVVALDPAPELLDEARRIDEREDVRIEYVVGKAERTQREDQSFDVVMVGQAWRWFDRPLAMREVKRVLRPGGWLLIAHFDWLPLPGNVVEATEQLIDTYNPEWQLGGSPGVHPEWLTDVRAGGFVAIESFSFDTVVRYSHESWRGRVRASAGVQASLSPDEVARFDERLRRALVERFPEEPLEVPHCVWALTCRLPGG